MFLFNCNLARSQVAITASPGIKFNSIKIGYAANERFMPYVGIQYMKSKYTLTETGKIYDSQANKLVDSKEIVQFEGNVLVPNLGARFNLQTSGTLRTYINASVLKPFNTGDFKKTAYADNTFDKDIDKLSAWGIEGGFGAEYRISDSFSLGGEYGLRNCFIDYDQYELRSVFNEYTCEFEDALFNTKVENNVNPTYFRFCLNSYL